MFGLALRLGAVAMVSCVVTLPYGVAYADASAGSVTEQSPGMHPLGNFSINRYDGLVVEPDGIRIEHLQDLAEIPTAQTYNRLDTNQDGAASAGELQVWSTGRCRSATKDMTATVAGKSAHFRLGSAHAQRLVGQAGLPTLRVRCTMSATVRLARGTGSRLVFVDRASDDGIGWREITARGVGVTLTASDVSARSVTKELTTYPASMLNSPLNQHAANLRVRLAGEVPLADGPDSPVQVGTIVPRELDTLTTAFMAMAARRHLTLGVAVAALAVAVALGALHAAAPGHGKTIMAAYAAGRRRHSLRAVLALGATVTVAHTAGVFLLGLIVTAGAVLAPATFYPWLAAGSGVLVSIVGLILLRRARSGHHHHSHPHQADGHHHYHPHGPHEAHGHAHPYAHDAPDLGHGPGHPDLGGNLATTRVARAGRERAGLLIMGLAGGMVPTPSAVVVLLGATALGHAWFGLLLVVAYGAGMAFTLAAAGLLAVHLNERIQRRLVGTKQARWFSALPLLTAALVLILGIILTVRGLDAALSTL